MSNESEDLVDLHWMFDMLHHIDAGLVVLNTRYEVQLWNSFMENHSGVSSSIAKQQSLFALFPELNASWLKQKFDNVFGLRTPIYIAWEQRPHVFPFKSYRPITGIADKMYQNVAIRPLSSPDGAIKHLCLVVYDVTDVATNKMALSAANRQLEQHTKVGNLTDLQNRKSLDEALFSLYASFKNKPTSQHSLVMFRLGKLAKIVERLGRDVGELALQKVEDLLIVDSRQGDFIGRFGREELVVVLPHTGVNGATVYGEKLRKKINSAVIKTPKGDIPLSVTIGVSELSTQDKSVASWLERADVSLNKL